MIFTLEALRARHGDSLVLHFGDPGKPQFIVIDGGPPGVYKDAFRPRLDELAARWGVDGKVRFEALVISHLDDDHIRGVLDLTGKLIETQKTKPLPFDVGSLWHNAFDDMVGKSAPELATAIAEAPARVAAAEGDMPPWSGESAAVVATVGQGRRLREDARKLGWEPNKQFGGRLIMAAAGAPPTVQFGPLKLTVIAPLEEELLKLQADWDKELAKLRKAGKAKEAAEVAEYLDDSVYNLASIVLLAELGGKSMLLTGDARGDLICAGLKRAGLLPDGGTFTVDLLKLPHHGSDRNVADDFFQRVRARHYVVSGDGRHDNPSPGTFAMIAKARADDDFTVHMTYGEPKGKVGPELVELFAADKEAGRTYDVAPRAADSLSIKVDLLDKVEY